MIEAAKMEEFKDGVESLEQDQLDFIETELGITPEQIASLVDDELNEKVYEPMCEIEIDEIPSSDEEESERCKMASEIVTVLGNSLAEANGWLDEEER